MARYLRDGGGRESSPTPRDLGRLERVPTVGFCESRSCTRLAAWRIGYGMQTVDLCSRHTLVTMRNQRIWALSH